MHENMLETLKRKLFITKWQNFKYDNGTKVKWQKVCIPCNKKLHKNKYISFFLFVFLLLGHFLKLHFSMALEYYGLERFQEQLYSYQ